MRRLAWTVVVLLVAALSLSLSAFPHSMVASAAAGTSLSDRRAMPVESDQGQVVHSPLQAEVLARRFPASSPIKIDAANQLDRNLTGRFAVEGALPAALTVGRNADAGVDVYKGVRGGKDVYVGITNNLSRRGAEHGDRFGLERLTDSSVTRGEARAIEQAMIVRNPGFENARNSISPNHPWYDDAVNWGESWLQRAGR